jgi:hypothetical protein
MADLLKYCGKRRGHYVLIALGDLHFMVLVPGHGQPDIVSPTLGH